MKSQTGPKMIQKNQNGDMKSQIDDHEKEQTGTRKARTDHKMLKTANKGHEKPDPDHEKPQRTRKIVMPWGGPPAPPPQGADSVGPLLLHPPGASGG